MASPQKEESHVVRNIIIAVVVVLLVLLLVYVVIPMLMVYQAVHAISQIGSQLSNTNTGSGGMGSGSGTDMGTTGSVGSTTTSPSPTKANGGNESIPINGEYSDWSDWSTCDPNTGQHTSTRTCKTSNCSDPLTKTESCVLYPLTQTVSDIDRRPVYNYRSMNQLAVVSNLLPGNSVVGWNPDYTRPIEYYVKDTPKNVYYPLLYNLEYKFDVPVLVSALNLQQFGDGTHDINRIIVSTTPNNININVADDNIVSKIVDLIRVVNVANVVLDFGPDTKSSLPQIKPLKSPVKTNALYVTLLKMTEYQIVPQKLYFS
jgi:hypothetical protein